jgi:glycosyltransferase involved in cell wall biosynthesis
MTRRVTGSWRLFLQFHRRFQRAGQRAAERAGVPFVLRVEALEVREEAAWGVRRPGYGRLVERLGELRIMRQADLLVPVSDALDVQLGELGFPEDRRFVLPNGVDTDKFCPGTVDDRIRRDNGLGGRFVVGWVGGFRPFHGLESVPDLARRLRERFPAAALCLIGTGPLLGQMREQIRGLEDTVRIIAPVTHEQIPRWVRSFDACLLLAHDSDFHYSPLKLYEYLACGKPVIAARVGQVEQVMREQGEMLVQPGDVDAIVDRVVRLASDPALRARLGAEGRSTVERSASWSARADAFVTALEDRSFLQPSSATG